MSDNFDPYTANGITEEQVALFNRMTPGLHDRSHCTQSDERCPGCGLTEVEYEERRECPRCRTADGARIVPSPPCLARWPVYAEPFKRDDRIVFRW